MWGMDSAVAVVNDIEAAGASLPTTRPAGTRRDRSADDEIADRGGAGYSGEQRRPEWAFRSKPRRLNRGHLDRVLKPICAVTLLTRAGVTC